MAELEEKLREAACFGDIDGVKELLSRGVNVNAQHDINGWTALHWAAKRNHLNIVNLLCNHGADKNIPTNKGEVAAQLTSEGVIKVLLNAMKGLGPSPPAPPKVVKKEKDSSFVPNYIRDPVLNYEVDVGNRDDLHDKEVKKLVAQAHKQKEKRIKLNNHHQEPEPHHKLSTNDRCRLEYESSEIILKIRTAGDHDQDFIEIELPRDALTLEYLIVMGCEELGLNASCIERVRKMPNTRLRRDKEVERMEDYQEIEFVLRQEPSHLMGQQPTPAVVNCNGIDLNSNSSQQVQHSVQQMEKETEVEDTPEAMDNTVDNNRDSAETNAEPESEEMEQAQT